MRKSPECDYLVASLNNRLNSDTFIELLKLLSIGSTQIIKLRKEK